MNKAKVKSNSSWLVKIGESFTRVSEKYMPDPSIFAVMLTITAFIISIVVTKVSPIQSLDNWYKGFWTLLSFAMQMSLVVIVGGVVADTPIIKSIINKIASIPKNGRQAAFVITLITILISFLQFGLSAVMGALLARNTTYSLKKRGVEVEYRLLSACSYIGYMTWCVGLSSSVGLTIATPGHFLEKEIGIIPMSVFMFNPMNIFLTISFVVVVPLIAYFLHPKDEGVQEIPEYALEALEAADSKVSEEEKTENKTFGEFLNNSKVVCMIIGLFGMSYVVRYFYLKGINLDLNIINTLFLFGGLLLHGTISKFVNSFSKSTSSAAGIIFQFPLYAGIMGIISYSGLGALIAEAIAKISTPFTFYFWTFIIASVLNFFTPSGGGQWAVQGPITIESAKIINGSVLKASLAVAYGNSWTNMAQPFWALAVLGVTGLKAKDIMGYSAALMLSSGFLFAIALLFFPV
ncbi:short-chain fatty acid transporter [Leptotrichia sp. OH3620_COT-345]|uniref:short-chain fatty acid transporter n=1 Tax=Leptotrichia sp. OH3620_COT-345 TaxID=2491048 RepID=UPI000F648415|nr:TIGR00366 family protein [Leptotrichia sp. OH3620_COT-345]RRD41081.1 short-chain fatty acid transporter [Leptotrichia sp. OH3620_COT-345]